MDKRTYALDRNLVSQVRGHQLQLGMHPCSNFLIVFVKYELALV